MIKSYIEREGKTRLVLAETRTTSSSCSSSAGGDLLHLVNGSDDARRAAGGLTPYAAAFYAAEVVLGLEFLRSLDVAHRDLKPRTCSSTAAPRRLADFGAVLDCSHAAGHDLGERHGSFEGTAEYVSPEVLQGFETTPRVRPLGARVPLLPAELRALPFRAATDFLLWEKIVAFADGDESAFEASPRRRARADSRGNSSSRTLAAAGRGRRREALRPRLLRGPLPGRRAAPRAPSPRRGAARAAPLPREDLADFSIEFMLELDARDDGAGGDVAGGAVGDDDAPLYGGGDAAPTASKPAACHVTGFQRLARSAAPRPDEERAARLALEAGRGVGAGVRAVVRAATRSSGVQLFYYRAKPEGLKTKPPAGASLPHGAARAAGPPPPGKFAFDADADTGRTPTPFVDDADDRAKWSTLAGVIAARDSAATSTPVSGS
ncbi:3-phosphoinositide-dependent protein kinase [Aureococcus anophagefferens]|nr:3-phosphoinositide-dependent protein kinase [Aureococcus anophagefferens]